MLKVHRLRIPTKPHSQAGVITTAVDSDYLHMNLKSWDPYGQIIGGTRTLWDLAIYLAQTSGVNIKDEKAMTAGEIAAAKIYPAILMSYLQALRSQKNIIDLCPIFVANVSTSDCVFKEDEWWLELNMCNHGSYPSIQGIEDLVTRINPIWIKSYAYELLNFPASYYIQWVPSKTTADMRALRVLLGTYAEEYQTFCNKASISTKLLDAYTFVNREVVKFKPYSFSDKDWLFWNATGCCFVIRNGADTGFNYMTARRVAAAEVFDFTTANWLSARDKYYIIPDDGEPSDLNAIVQMFFGHCAENLLGCIQADDGGGINDNTLEAADVFGAKLSRKDPATTNDTVAVALDRKSVEKLFNAFPSVFSNQGGAASTLIKLTDEAGESASPDELDIAGGLRSLTFDTAVWDNANALIVQTFFQEMFGKMAAGVRAPVTKYFRKSKGKPNSKTIGDNIKE